VESPTADKLESGNLEKGACKSGVDADGFALAATQGLYELVKGPQVEIE
jgi:hypothetical protein